MGTVLRHCPTCGDEREFETPPCLDDHGEECPELACLECGTALLVGLMPLARPVPQRLAAVGTAA